MASVRAFLRTARMIRNTPHLAAGLPADDDVLLDAPDERLAPVLVAAGRGEYAPELAVTRGWEPPARGELLRDAVPLISAAAEAEPRDPVPWRIALDQARGGLLRQDALAQLRMIGPYATSFPWDRVSDDPLGQFLELRYGVRLEIASGIPLRSRSAAAPCPRSEHTDPTRPDDH
ncbi:hypothetical protein E0500_032760 [Streptomyces sp. KM273126]|uniref:hypothetical protein n=1 Tax=Streptomyces sp. KM273126 TaxID=2545247 RepID=UPI001039A2DA|nr:hypothetical protein [Streptomyces sp. KM273126]MBA2811965.1 hypothetical protein [Streptomyces sp. KM273126]